MKFWLIDEKHCSAQLIGGSSHVAVVRRICIPGFLSYVFQMETDMDNVMRSLYLYAKLTRCCINNVRSFCVPIQAAMTCPQAEYSTGSK